MKTNKQYIKTLKTNLRKFYQKWQEETSNKDLLQGSLDKMMESYSKEHRRNEKLSSELQDMRRERDELLEERRSGTWLNRMHNTSPEMGCDPNGEEESKLNAKMHEMAELRITNRVLLSKLIKAGLWKGDENPNLYPPLMEDSQRQLRRIFNALEALIGFPEGTDPEVGLHIKQVADHAEVKLKELDDEIRNLKQCYGSLQGQAKAVWDLLMKATNWSEEVDMNPDSIKSASVLVQNLSQAWANGISARLQAGLECKLDSEGFPYIDGVPLTGSISSVSNDLWKLLLKATGSDPDTKLSLTAMYRIEDKLLPLSDGYEGILKGVEEENKRLENQVNCITNIHNGMAKLSGYFWLFLLKLVKWDEHTDFNQDNVNKMQNTLSSLSVEEGGEPDPVNQFQLDLEKIMNETKVMLVRKNTSYGDSALNPVRIFSRLNSREGLLVRIDDKLNRIINQQTYPGDNDLDDLIGYLFLLKIAGIREERKES